MVPWILLTALIVLSTTTIASSLAQRQELHSEVERQLQTQLEDAVASWEQRLLDRLEQWLEDAANDPMNAWLTQVQLRQREPWFDSLYLWVPQRYVTVKGKQKLVQASFLFPRLPPTENPERLRFEPCLARARLVTLTPGATPGMVADAYVDGCKKASVDVRLRAASEAASRLHDAGRLEEALVALDSAGIGDELSVRAAIQQGLPPFRVVANRMQRAEVLDHLDRTDEAADLLFETGAEVAALDAPEAAEVLQYLRIIVVPGLEQSGRSDDAAQMRRMIDQAERRIRAYREVEERIFPRTSVQATQGPRFTYDQYGDPPFVLFYGAAKEGEVGAALQLDQSLLLADFLATLRHLRDDIVITDAGGVWVSGSHDVDEVVVQVPFSRTLTHLRVGLHDRALDSRLEKLSTGWVTLLVLSIFTMLMGMLAFVAQIRANRHLRALLQRQRAFTTRVTHELKTPLAGMRVMAENIEAGAFRGDEQLEAMARKIVDESDRLAARVDEILAVARAYTIPSPEPFDPEEAVLEAIDTWGPRYEEYDVAFQADLHPTDEVVGHMEAVRDSVGCLLDNALKYRDPAKERSQVWLTLLQEGRWIVIDVTDNGLGVPPHLRREIFEQFVRVEADNRGMSGGHGLGLSQVAEVIRAHEGTVECKDGVDGGAKFVLRLPALR